MGFEKLKIIKLIVLSVLFSFVVLTSAALAADEFNVVRSISDTQVCPGDNVSVTLVLTANQHIVAPAIIEETIPSEWELTEVSDDSATYKSTKNEWIWSGDMDADEIKTVVYILTVPLDAADGVYNITGSASALDLSSISIIGDYQITVSSTSIPVAADFYSNVTSGKAPLAVKFTDDSVNATFWQWDFDNDGTIDSTDQNPVYTFNDAGTYTVKLTASSETDSDTATGTISVESGGSSSTSIEAGFTANTTSGQAPLSVKFTDLSTASGTTITSWEWDFDNDGIVDSTDQNPVYTYTENGTYTVKLVISDGSDNDAFTSTGYITVGGEDDDDDDGDYTEATAVSLSATIIPAISIEVTPGALDFGTLSAGEVSSEHTLHIKNKGATDTTVTAQVTDVAKGLYEDGLMLNSGTWDGYTNVIESETTESVQTSLHVPADFIGIGSMEGKLVFWAEAS
ncbi:MAG: hypothetical protein PWQ51_191 [Methanolobus sp.]|jgi:PKD repeat protein|nr:hypothetical protein [Methanolobus sp.]